MPALPSALTEFQRIQRRLIDKAPVLFLDYDGTLHPIVPDPSSARLPEDDRATLEQLDGRFGVVIVSGRDADDVRDKVGLPDIVYAGSHGFDVLSAAGQQINPPGAEQFRTFLPHLAAAEAALRARLRSVGGARVERKRFAVAVHFRAVPAEHMALVNAAFDSVARAHPMLVRTAGKMVLELRPGVPWDKGRAVIWLLGALGFDRPGIVPIYIGDDVTDEDAFRAVRCRGIGIVVDDPERSIGAHETAASFSLAGPRAVMAFLNRLLTIPGQRGADPRQAARR